MKKMRDAVSVANCMAALLCAALCLGGVHDPRDTNPQQSEDVGELTKMGLEAYQNGDYEAAVEYMIRARQIEDHPTLTYNIARCYLNLERCELAKMEFERVLRYEDIDRELREHAEEWLLKLGDCDE